MADATPLHVAVTVRAVMPLHGVGGLERAARDLVRHLTRRGVHVTLITPPPRKMRCGAVVSTMVCSSCANPCATDSQAG